MSEAFETLLCILLSPYNRVGSYLRSRRSQNHRGEPEAFQERRRKYAPPPLPSTRQRALSLPLPTPIYNVPTTVQRTHPQAQAPLFSQFPLEIRRLIYEDVLGGKVLHILPEEKKLWHYVCRAIPDFYSQRLCSSVAGFDGQWVGWRSFGEPTDGGLLPLLRTCRKVSVRILYMPDAETGQL